jgi:N-acetylglucosaminyldiphosphoundecaprenol N-acetyl-beta-D-mannosaminyltransferase
MGVGGSFDVVSGELPRAPLWMQRAGFEWLFRLLLEPRRLGWRYLRTNAIFAWLLLGLKLRSERRASR